MYNVQYTVGIPHSLQPSGQPWNHFSNSRKEKRSFSSPKRRDQIWGTHSLLLNRHRRLLHGGKGGPDVKPTIYPPSNAKAKNDWHSISSPSFITLRAWTQLSISYCKRPFPIYIACWCVSASRFLQTFNASCYQFTMFSASVRFLIQ